jgi:putative ATPase
VAKEVDLEFEAVSAIVGGVADLRKIFESAKERKIIGQGTLLFVDEIHRFNRAQQDVFLSSIEEGIIILVGATTENPSFELNAALMSRCRVFVLNRLDEESLEDLLKRAEKQEKKTLPLTSEARETLIRMADGDGRAILNFAESLFLYNELSLLDPSRLVEAIQKRAPIYDKAQEGHYNLISALHKSIRGSDPDASLYWFCRMVDAGEDLLFIARRLVRAAVEDIGLADPNALTQAINAKEAYEFLGSPEGELALAQCVIYLAMAPKSNAAYVAYKKALSVAKELGSYSPPKHILNAPTGLMKSLGYGQSYIYDHDTEENFSGQNYFPDEMEHLTFYQPKGIGVEEKILKKLKELEALRKQKQ